MDRITGSAELNGTRFYYEEAGTGFPVVMLHACIADLRMWDPQFAPFAEKYRAVRYDRRGFGRTPFAPSPSTSRDDLLALLDYLRIERAALMGCSCGGETIIDFALEHPERTAALIPIGAGLSGYAYNPQPPRYWSELEAALKKNDFATAAEFSTRIWLDGRGRSPQKVDPTVRQKALEMAEGALRGEKQRQAHPEPSLEPPVAMRLESIQAPMLTVVGDLDDQDAVQISALLAAVVPGSKRLILEKTAHLPNLERPAEFNQVALAFLDAVLA
jgi:pimeloyl-ACP methyl ester carboxylesterase